MPKETIYTGSFPGDPLAMDIPIGWGTGPGVSIGVLRSDRVEGSYAVEDGLYAELSRDQLNGLIRVLRKSRDKTFGRDE